MYVYEKKGGGSLVMSNFDLFSMDVPIDAIPLNVAVYRYDDGDFIFVDFNAMAEKTENISKSELIGKKLTEVFPTVKEFGLFDVLLRIHDKGGYEEFDLNFYEDERISGWKHNIISRLDNGDVIALYTDLTKQKSYEIEEANRNRRTKIFKCALLEWAQVDYKNADSAIKQVTKILAETLNVERSSIWLYNDDKTFLNCISIYNSSDKKHHKCEFLEVKAYPEYFKAIELGSALVIEDVQNDFRTLEFGDEYLKRLDIRSMLDIPIFSQGKIIGVVCNEHVDSVREWTKEEEEFVVAVANNVSLALEIQKREKIEGKLQSLGNIIDSSLNEVFIFDKESFKFSYANKQALKNIGYSFDEILSMTPVDIKPEHTMQSFMSVIEPLKNGKEEYLILETVHQRKDGTTYNVEIRLEKMSLDNSEQFVVIAHDITNRKVAQIELLESEEKFRSIAENSLIGIFIYQNKYVYANQAFVKMSGYSLDEIYDMNAWDLLEEPYKTTAKEVALRRLAGEHFPQEYKDIKVIKKNGNIRTMRISTQTIKYKGKYAGVGSVIDITDIKETKQKLQLLARAVEQMGELVRITDRDGVITYVNDALVAHSGYTHVELIGKNVSIFKSGKYDQAFYEELWETILAAKTYSGVFINRKKSKEIFYEEETITPILDDDNNIQYFVATSKDITERVHMEEELQRLANMDSLTGIFNRHRTNKEIDIEIARAKRYHGDFALAMIDIDHFKVVNDTYGHDMGDYVLKEFASIVQEHIRESDRFGRWGGEEFIIILPELDEGHAVSFAEKLLKRVERHSFKDITEITISIGITFFNEKSSKQELLKKVDEALYKAKGNGRNIVEVC